MDENLNKIPSKELIELYTKTKQFNDYLKKEQINIEKMRDNK